MKLPFSQRKSRKELYKEEYEASKQDGEGFFPETIARDAIIALLLVGIIITLAIVLPARSEPPADPASTTYNPRPEWYFLFFFQFLKLFPGRLEPVAAVIIPIVALTILALVPFLDRTPERHYTKRATVTGIGVVVMAAFVTLEVGGILSAPARPAGEESPLVQKGRLVYREINCAYCHSIGGIGGTIGPDLSNVGSELDKKTLLAYLQNPHAMVPTTLHPKLQFTTDEINALADYLATLGAPISYGPQAPALFEKNCSGCHMLNGKGGTAGPDLSTIGKRRSIGFIEAFTTDPRSVIPGATMPAFRGVLTAEEIKDIAAYLASLRGQTP